MRNATSRILTGTLAGALLVAASAHADRSEWPDNFTVGTASQGGTYFVYGS
ncbi:C4-dicarboxylate ABC transporter substrate-binding protein, partial [Halomonas sp. EGI 63088]|nr:C4-dicarboxylate ABC transporter substrate-binding protein [Halomonas flagellata]